MFVVEFEAMHLNNFIKLKEELQLVKHYEKGPSPLPFPFASRGSPLTGPTIMFQQPLLSKCSHVY